MPEESLARLSADLAEVERLRKQQASVPLDLMTIDADPRRVDTSPSIPPRESLRAPAADPLRSGDLGAEHDRQYGPKAKETFDWIMGGAKALGSRALSGIGGTFDTFTTGPGQMAAGAAMGDKDQVAAGKERARGLFDWGRQGWEAATDLVSELGGGGKNLGEQFERQREEQERAQRVAKDPNTIENMIGDSAKAVIDPNATWTERLAGGVGTLAGVGSLLAGPGGGIGGVAPVARRIEKALPGISGMANNAPRATLDVLAAAGGKLRDAAIGTAPAGSAPRIPSQFGSRSGSVRFGPGEVPPGYRRDQISGLKAPMTKEEMDLQNEGTALMRAAGIKRASPSNPDAVNLPETYDPSGGSRGGVLNELAETEMPANPMATPMREASPPNVGRTMTRAVEGTDDEDWFANLVNQDPESPPRPVGGDPGLEAAAPSAAQAGTPPAASRSNVLDMAAGRRRAPLWQQAEDAARETQPPMGPQNSPMGPGNLTPGERRRFGMEPNPPRNPRLPLDSSPITENPRRKGWLAKVIESRNHLSDLAEQPGGGEFRDEIARRGENMLRNAATNADRNLTAWQNDIDKFGRDQPVLNELVEMDRIPGVNDRFLFSKLQRAVDSDLPGARPAWNNPGSAEIERSFRKNVVADPGQYFQKIGGKIMTDAGEVPFVHRPQGDRFPQMAHTGLSELMHDPKYAEDKAAFISDLAFANKMEPTATHQYLENITKGIETPTNMEFARQFKIMPAIYEAPSGTKHAITQFDVMPHGNNPGAAQHKILSSFNRAEFVRNFGQRLDGEDLAADPLFKSYLDNGGDEGILRRFVRSQHGDRNAGEFFEPGTRIQRAERSSDYPVSTVRGLWNHAMKPLMLMAVPLKSLDQFIQEVPAVAGWINTAKAAVSVALQRLGAIPAQHIGEGMIRDFSNLAAQYGPEAQEALRGRNVENLLSRLAGKSIDRPQGWVAKLQDDVAGMAGKYWFDELATKAKNGSGLSRWDTAVLDRHLQMGRDYIRKLVSGQFTPEEYQAMRNQLGTRMAQKTQFRALPRSLRGNLENSVAWTWLNSFDQYNAQTMKAGQAFMKALSDVSKVPNAGERWQGYMRALKGFGDRMVGHQISGEVIRNVTTMLQGRNPLNELPKDERDVVMRAAGNLMYSGLFGRLGIVGVGLMDALSKYTGRPVDYQGGAPKAGGSNFGSAPAALAGKLLEKGKDVAVKAATGEIQEAAAEAAGAAHDLTIGQSSVVKGIERQAGLLPPVSKGGGQSAPNTLDELFDTKGRNRSRTPPGDDSLDELMKPRGGRRRFEEEDDSLDSLLKPRRRRMSPEDVLK